ncbi:MAG: hypothetical protein JWN98_1764 [Abditibacteriota bacterium]|nr:hypothetical protein [Abditibacteriota bacterium]
MKSRYWIGTALLALQVLWPVGARATVLLKPNGEDAVPLRTKFLSANIVIDGALATAKQESVFQNGTARRIEADFYYTVRWCGCDLLRVLVWQRESGGADC